MPENGPFCPWRAEAQLRARPDVSQGELVRVTDCAGMLPCGKTFHFAKGFLLVFSPRFLEPYIPNNAREDWKLLTPENYDRTCFHIEALSLFSLHSCELFWLVTIFSPTVHQSYGNVNSRATSTYPTVEDSIAPRFAACLTVRSMCLGLASSIWWTEAWAKPCRFMPPMMPTRLGNGCGMFVIVDFKYLKCFGVRFRQKGWHFKSWRGYKRLAV